MRQQTVFNIFTFLVLLFSSTFAVASTDDKKSLVATFITEAITIDGKLDETIWQKSAIASQFFQIEPYNGKAASLETKVYILFDEKAIYIGANIIDPNPDSISLELRSRDNAGTADAFMVKIDPFNDGLLAYGFEVTASGVQIDMKTNSNNNDDLSWDAVWKSHTEILADGWSVEMMIPYSALRFPKNETQTWGINFYRTIQRYRETTSWNFIDVKSKSSINQTGQLLINEVITPPLRLSATPYLSAITSHNSATNKWSNGYNYGMDMKLGLTESFTLDLTMIPDFGQVESDDIIYSLSPFEVYYDEKRPFFTEGTELFSKGNVFYSKRIGATPDGYQQVNESYEPDEIKSNPANAQLINAAKLSGKTSNGLAIGVFNALTANTYAVVEGIEGIEKKILTEPLTNFNMLVFEQALPNNSQVSIYNTNVYKPEINYIANVSGTDFGLRDRKNNYELSGMLNISQHYLPGISPELGSRMLFAAAKINGNFQAETWINYISPTYNPNDMGFQMRNNELSNGLELKYKVFEPSGNVLRWTAQAEIDQTYLASPQVFTSLDIGANTRITFVNHLTIGGDINSLPLGYKDYYEARTAGRYVQKPANFSVTYWGSPDYRKKIMADYRLGFLYAPEWDQFNWWAIIKPRWRVKENFLIIPNITADLQNNSRGYVTNTTNEIDTQTIVFGRRDIINITSSISADYIFTTTTSLAFRLRHYWLNVSYLSYYELGYEGELIPSNYSEINDFNVNTFNIDMVFRWNFAPGSELLLVWKNAVYAQEYGEDLSRNYFRNLEETFSSPVGNSISIKFLYYLDWQQIKPTKKQVSRSSGDFGS